MVIKRPSLPQQHQPDAKRRKVTAYPFRATRTQAWRKAVTAAGGAGFSEPQQQHNSTMVRLPDTVSEARNTLTSASCQQAMAAEYLRNSIAVSYAGSGVNVFHLGGLPGAGKTTIVKELIAELDNTHLVDSSSSDVMLCSKSNSAKTSLMSACETGRAEGELLYQESSFSTLNKGFGIPVIHNKNDITHDKIRFWTFSLKRKVAEGLNNLRFLAIDEYTMASCREIVYIDALLRIIKFRPDLPFGGVFVVFLGDNRQNSAVVDDNNQTGTASTMAAARRAAKLNRRRDKANGAAAAAAAGNNGDDNKDTFKSGGVEDEFDNLQMAKLYTEALTKLLCTFCNDDQFGDPEFLEGLITNRIDRLSSKIMAIKKANNDVVSGYKQKTKQQQFSETQPQKVIACEEGSDDDDPELFSSAAFMNMIENVEATASTTASLSSSSSDFCSDTTTASLGNESGTFAEKCNKLFTANDFFREVNETSSSSSSSSPPSSAVDVLGRIPLSMIVEEGVTAELDHLHALSHMKEKELARYVSSIFKIVVGSAVKSMTEIDYSGREKMYIVSSLSERFNDVHVTALMDEEILVSKYVSGSDPKCIDRLPFQSERNRHRAIAASVRNAFIRDGQDIKEQVPIAVYFKNNLPVLANFLENPDLTYEQLLQKSKELETLLSNPSAAAAKKGDGKQQQRYEDDCGDFYVDDDYKEDNFFGNDTGDIQDFGEEERETVCRDDVPSEVTIDSSTSDRVGAMVDFHVKWNKWLKTCRPSDLVRSRLWHLYILVRMQQVRFDTGLMPSFDKSSFSGRLFFPVSYWGTNIAGAGREDDSGRMHDDYWRRVLSMPTYPGGDAQQDLLLPAFSSMLSAISRTYIMSSLKRVNVIKHAYALMYGVSLLDMTVNLEDLTDTRKMNVSGGDDPSSLMPVGYTSEIVPAQYFGSIFPCMVDEFFMQKQSDVMREGKLMQSVNGSLNISHVIKLAEYENKTQAASSRNSNNTKYSNKSVVIAVRMLTSISKSNRRRVILNKEKVKQQQQQQGTCLQNRFAGKAAAVAADTDAGKSAVAERMLGAITLTRRHAQKNAVSNLVDTSIISQTNGVGAATAGGANSIKAARSDTKFFVNNIDLTYVSHEKPVTLDHKNKIVNLLKNRKGSGHLFDFVTDSTLMRESQNLRNFSRVLINQKNRVTKVKSVNLYQGQNVVFTHTYNSANPIHGVTEKFVTKDTGVVTDLFLVNGTMHVSVLVERLGKKPVVVKEGRHFFGSYGSNNNFKMKGPAEAGYSGSYVRFLPLESGQAMTIYSCQGQTFFRDTVVDLSGASTQDAYVAITRNNNPLNLYIVQTHEPERKNLCNIKYSMNKDKASLMPIGGLGSLGGGSYINNDEVRLATEMVSSKRDTLAVGDGNVMYAALNPNHDIVSAAQKFIMDKSGNALAFNAEWMANTANELSSNGLEAQLNKIRAHFFGSERSEYAKYYETVSHGKFVELYTAVLRSVTHYAIATGAVKTPSVKMSEEYVDKYKNKKDYIKIHPSFVNRPPKESTVAAFLYDVAPHSSTMVIFQFYVHYIFLVYEHLHICNSSFAFLPAPSPVLNQNVRPNTMAGTTDIPKTCHIQVPFLGFESKEFAGALDGGERDESLREPITYADDLGNNINDIRDSACKKKGSKSVYDVSRALKCIEYVSKCMTHNMRRTGKFCRPNEACGLSKHGAVVVATSTEKGENIHVETDKGWASMSNDANLFSTTIFMTKVAAASGVTILRVKNQELLEPSTTAASPGTLLACEDDISPSKLTRFKMSEEVIWSGQVYPMRRVQFTVHAKRLNKPGNVTSPVRIFGTRFKKAVFQCSQVESAKIVAVTEMFGHEFAGHSTSDMRNTLLNGIGTVTGLREVDGVSATEDDDNATCSDRVINGLERFMIDQMNSVFTACNGKRLSFFISCQIK